MGTHTPGPWHSFDERNHGRVVVAVHGKTGWHGIAEVYDKKNAPLITAAPDLLAACEAAIKCCGSSSDWQGETRKFLLLMEAAVVKAKGL